MRILIYILLFTLPLSAHAADDPSASGTISPNITQIDALTLGAKLAQAFARHECEEVPSLAPPDVLSRLPPLGTAIAAYCLKDVAEQERLFEAAEKAAPAYTVVFFLHAKARWARDRASAIPLWRKVEMLARDTAVRQVARDYLDGNATGREMIQLESEWTYFLDTRLGGGYQTNPLLLPPSQPAPRNSPSINGVLNAGLLRRFPGGSLAGNYTATGNFYTQMRGANLLQHDLELPLSLRAGTKQDLRLRPFASLQTIDSQRTYDYAGIAMQGIAYRGRYRSSVEGSVYVDNYADPALAPQAGTHLRFDYAWEYYPSHWFARWLLYLEHVQAGRSNDPVHGVVFFSHNDLALQTFWEWNTGFVLLGFSGKVILREDVNDSRYRVASATSPLIVKRREDLQVSLQPSVSLPLGRGMYLIATYFLNRRWSGFGADDLLDENFADQGAQLLWRFTLEAL